MPNVSPMPVDERTGRTPASPAPNFSAVFDSPAENECEDVEPPFDFSLLDPPMGPDELGYIAHYRVKSILGYGGMGVVFHAEDTHLSRPVALKVMKREYIDSFRSRERFLQEARAAAGIESDHIVTVYQVGLHNDIPYLAMQLLQGETLDARLRREGQISIADALLIARQTAEGLAAAHDSGLVHRDIKPANLWLEQDSHTRQLKRVKVLDFGLARVTLKDKKLTNAGMVLGTPQYMSPEQALGAAVDCRSDLFSLGTVLFEMLSGRLPFTSESPTGILVEIASGQAPRISTLIPTIPPEVDQLVAVLLAKEPQNRFESARDVVDLIDSILVEYSFLTPLRMSGVIGMSARETTRMGHAAFERVVPPTLSMPVPLHVAPPETFSPHQEDTRSPATPSPMSPPDAAAAPLAQDLEVWKKKVPSSPTMADGIRTDTDPDLDLDAESVKSSATAMLGNPTLTRPPAKAASRSKIGLWGLIAALAAGVIVGVAVTALR